MVLLPSSTSIVHLENEDQVGKQVGAGLAVGMEQSISTVLAALKT